ncbi:MAG: MATE family efflux transporter [Ruminococcaceae bacterium]|nr:MATE family efflux transporter [Oscillospiraceae bacterium]
MAKRRYEMDMCRGPLVGKILRFSLPLMLSGILQLLFNAADLAVVGQYSGDTALAAVGSTSALTNLLVNLFIGLSVGANVIVARLYGSGDYKSISKAVHTAITLALIGGVALVFIGYFLSRPLLEMMDTPADVIDRSVVYMRIIFCGMPALLLYNFGAAILRSIGDTKRPLYFLLFAGVLNVVLNLFFVIVLNMDVDGVALATILSQCVSAALILTCLMRMDGPCRVSLRSLRLYKTEALQIVRIGLPAGIQSIMFSISNVLIQSSINSFGKQAMAGNTAGGNLEGFIYTAMNSFYQAALSFTGQNNGAKQYRRINRVLWISLIFVTIAGVALGMIVLLFGRQLLSIYSDEAVVIDYGMLRLRVFMTTYFLCGIMEVCGGMMRGMGYAITPMIVSLAGACGFRVLWIYTIFAANRTLTTLYISYPISWILTALAHLVCFLVVKHRLPREDQPLPDPDAA